jgi:putative membrane protein
MKRITYMMCCLTLGSVAFALSQTAGAQTTNQDKQFLTNASQSNYDEIQLGKLAEQKATTAGVKTFGRRMVTDHTRLTEKMKPFATEWGVQPPASLSSDAQSAYDKLKGLSGKDFDKEYIDDMVTDHTKDLDAFDSELNSTQNAKFKAAVAQGKTVIATHKTMAESLQKKM